MLQSLPKSKAEPRVGDRFIFGMPPNCWPVKVLAIVETYAMVRVERCTPFVVRLKDLTYPIPAQSGVNTSGTLE